MGNKIKIIAGIILIIFIFSYCSKDDWYTVEFENNITFPEQLSELNLFYDMPNLTPASDVHLYEMASTLFTDHAEKQRLIKLPPNTKMTKLDSGLPDFPNGTILAKTFYYYHNAQQPDEGKNIIETRILLKSGNIWNIGTYLWNDAQTDATYIENGHNTNVNWTDTEGNLQAISYSVPKATDCAMCHQSDEIIIPIGPKLKNLNRNILINDIAKNQLVHFRDINLIDDFDLDELTAFPSYGNPSLSIEERGRAYLDINCAHCHTQGGIAEDEWYNFDYDTPMSETGILWDKEEILEQFSSGDMPYIGTSVVDEEGLRILTEFIEAL